MLDTDRVVPGAIRYDLGAIFVSLELSRRCWLVTSLSPGLGEKLSRRQLSGGDLAGLLELIGTLKRQARARTGVDCAVVSIQEAGFDGFWLHRELETHGVESWVVDPASVAVSRRRRRAKTDKIDGEGLMRTLLAFKRGEPRVCSMVHAPTPEAEDRRRPCREREALMKERIAHANRIKGLLLAQGVSDYEPLRKRGRGRLDEVRTGDGRPLPAGLQTQIRRELARLELVEQQLATVEAERDALLEPAADGKPAPGARLTQLKGIAEERAAVLGGEVLWRSFDNRRQLGGYSGLVDTPFKSGRVDRDQGISKAGNARVRRTLIELAWSWLQHQPASELTGWFHQKVGPRPTAKRRKVMITALARKLLIALWRFETQGVVPKGALLKSAA